MRAKRKKEKVVDFKKKKTGVGARKERDETAFKAKSLTLPSQGLATSRDPAAALTSRALALGDLVPQSGHYNVRIRKTALEGMAELVRNHSGTLARSMQTLAEATLERMLDSEPLVRKALHQLLGEIFNNELTRPAFEPFLGLLAMYVRSAMSHVDEAVRCDGLRFLTLWTEAYPSSVAPHLNDLLTHYVVIATDRAALASSSTAVLANSMVDTSSVRARAAMLASLVALLRVATGAASAGASCREGTGSAGGGGGVDARAGAGAGAAAGGRAAGDYTACLATADAAGALARALAQPLAGRVIGSSSLTFGPSTSGALAGLTGASDAVAPAASGVAGVASIAGVPGVPAFVAPLLALVVEYWVECEPESQPLSLDRANGLSLVAEIVATVLAYVGPDRATALLTASGGVLAAALEGRMLLHFPFELPARGRVTGGAAAAAGSARAAVLGLNVRLCGMAAPLHRLRAAEAAAAAATAAAAAAAAEAETEAGPADRSVARERVGLGARVRAVVGADRLTDARPWPQRMVSFIADCLCARDDEARAFVPHLLAVLPQYLHGVDAATQAALLGAFASALDSVAGGSSDAANETACLAFVRYALRAAAATGVVASAWGLENDASVARLVIAPELVLRWTGAMPKLLWRVGSERLDSAAAALETLLFVARLPATAPAVAASARALVPLFCAQTAARGLVFGPFLAWPLTLQHALLALVQLVPETPPSLVPALLRCALEPTVSCELLGGCIECVATLAASGAVGAATGASFAVSLLVAPDALEPSPRAPAAFSSAAAGGSRKRRHSTADAGDAAGTGAAPAGLVAALDRRRVCGLWLTRLCGGSAPDAVSVSWNALERGLAAQDSGVCAASGVLALLVSALADRSGALGAGARAAFAGLVARVSDAARALPFRSAPQRLLVSLIDSSTGSDVLSRADQQLARQLVLQLA